LLLRKLAVEVSRVLCSQFERTESREVNKPRFNCFYGKKIDK